MKIFFDTNVYVSETLVGGLAESLIDATIRADWRIYVSSYLLDECERVIDQKLGKGRRLAMLTRSRASLRARLIEPGASRHTVAKDAADGPILRAALEAGVDYLVSDDRHLLELHPYEGLKIISMQDYRQLLTEQGLFNRR
jgi:putative PIN family toxin of toxin-antitoxin system